MKLGLTPAQTIGPFFGHALPWPEGPYVLPEGAPGGLWLRGRVLDGAGQPVSDALVEVWQAGPDGRFNHPDDPRGPAKDFRGFGRAATDAEGRYALHTCKPGRVPGPDGGLQAPHMAVSVFARGLLDRVVTRVYFADEARANAEDWVLSRIHNVDARATLIAARTADGYRFDIRLQGDGETVFFAL